MLFTSKKLSLAARLAGCVLIALTMAGCGGGGGSPGGSTAVGTGTGTTPVVGATLAIAVLDSAGAPVTTLSGGQGATVKVSALTATGTPAVGAIVTFTVSDATLVAFTPVSGSALTDASGVAVITIKPATLTSDGAAMVTATSVIGTSTAVASFNVHVGPAPLTVGTLAFSPAPTGPLPAFSTLNLNIPITSGSAPATTADGLSLSSLCKSAGKADIVAGALSNGVLSAAYTNTGCVLGTDTITVSIGNSSKTINVDVVAAPVGAVNFIGSNLSGSSLVLKGSGGQGRSESAQLTFQVVDQHNNPLTGVVVVFAPTTTTGGLSVSPLTATTDATGKVNTVVSSGTIPTPVRVSATATVSGFPPIPGLSDALTISTGLPIQRNMSLSSDVYNIEGGNYDGEIANLTVRMADQYGNPVSDGTTVNFVTEGGAVGTSAQGACTTTDGSCSVQLRSQAARPTNGRVTVLAFVQGIENFTDANGDGQYSCTKFVDSAVTQANYRPLVDACVAGFGEPFADQGDPFLDTGVQATVFGQPAKIDGLDGFYDGVSRDGVAPAHPEYLDRPFPFNHAAYRAAGDGQWGLNYIWRQAEIVFSTSAVTLKRQFVDPVTGSMRDWLPSDGAENVIANLAGTGCTKQRLSFRIFDANNNPAAFGTALSAVDADKVSPGTFGPAKVLSTAAIGGTYHTVDIKPDSACASGSFGLQVMTPKGTGVIYSFFSN